LFFIRAFLGANLHTDNFEVGKSTLERVWTMYFIDISIHATNRFSKFQTCERLKKMVHSGNIEEGRELSKEESLKLGNDKV